MTASGLYGDHVAEMVRTIARALSHARGRHAGVVLHAGSRTFYPADDQAVPFRTFPHFARIAPVPGPDHLVVLRPGATVRLAYVAPRDYWEEPPGRPAHPFEAVLDVREAHDLGEAALALGDVSDCALVGSRPELATMLGIACEAVNPAALVFALDWYRGMKTPYEVECIREANRVAARGHVAARAAAEAGASERAVHAAYLEATGALDGETPYPNIVAWDEKSAILHYHGRRATTPERGHTFLIDAGASHHGYASDVTRTYAMYGAHPIFREALDRMETLQRRLADAVAPSVPFVALHADAVRGVAEILCDLQVLRCDIEEACARGLARAFLPHGLGHHLGLQVHDVGGRQVSPAGDQREPPASHPHLRTTRALAPGHVVTIEPGLYFIPMLLDAVRAGSDAQAVDWPLVEALAPCGGIRIEDDVLVTDTGCENLTRPAWEAALER